MIQMNNLYVGDCLDILKTLPDDSIDLVITSPPYENCREYSIGFNLQGQDWVDWCLERYIECNRICKGLVAFVIQGPTKNFQWSASPALLMADLHRKGIKLRNPVIFNRVGIPGSGGPDWLRGDTEFIVCSSKGKLPWSNNTACGQPPKFAPGGAMSYRNKKGIRKHTKTRRNGKKEQQSYNPPKIANPGTLLSLKVGYGHMGSKLSHDNEAPFPDSLPEFFIKSFCPPQGIILDCFCGSGSSIVTAQNLGRQWIGIDIRQSQIDLTIKRLAEIGYTYDA